MEIYRPLIDDLRKSIRECNSHFFSAYGFIDRDKWVVLLKYFDDATIKAIEGYDKKLYNDLVRVKEEIIPLIAKIADKRRQTFKDIQKDWEDILYDTRITFNVEDFVQKLSSSIILEIWKENIEESKLRYHLLLKERLNQRKQLDTPPQESTFDELIKVAVVYMDAVKEEYKEVQKLFKEIIQEGVIPKMEETIKKQFT